MLDEFALSEIAYSAALEAVASGVTRDETHRYILARYLRNSQDIDAVLSDALADALAQGVEREDIDPSWFPA